jgi:hypothetical protein
MKATLKDLFDRADRAIERGETIACDVAVEHCQIFDNVKHLDWFRRAVAKALTEEVRKYEHLEVL